MFARHYGLHESPFALTPDTGYFFMHRGQRDALNVILIALHADEGLLKVVGEVGTGKTLLCRKLLNTLDGGFYTAYLPNPALSPTMLRRALAHELAIELPADGGQHCLTELIYKRLIELAGAGRRVVVLVDEAQAMPAESLEALRLLTNLETEKQKLLQIVLFGQPELDERLARPALRQVRQRIAFSYRLEPLGRDELAAYIAHRLVKAGYQGSPLFIPAAVAAVYAASRGVPRLINLICNKALLLAYGKGDHVVRRRYVRQAALDTEGVPGTARRGTASHGLTLTLALNPGLAWLAGAATTGLLGTVLYLLGIAP